MGPAEDSQVIKLQIALQQGDVEGFEQAVLDMSTPNHTNYGQHCELSRCYLSGKRLG